MRDTYVKVLRVGLHVLKARSDAVVAQVQAPIQMAASTTNLAPVQQAMADDPPTQGTSPEAKITFLRRVLAAWEPLAVRADERTRDDMKAQIAAINALLDRGDLRATAPIYHRLMEVWNTYGLNQMNTAVRAVLASYCQTAPADLRRDLASTEAEMQLVPDHAQLPIWERSLDRIRVQAAALPTEGCLAGNIQPKEGSFEFEATKASALLDLATQAVELRQQVFAADLAGVPISAQDRLEIARYSGVQRAENLARSLFDRPRPLTVEVTTPAAERYADRPVSFRIGGLDQSWGAGVLVAIDYGDRSLVSVISADDARKQFFVHSYVSPIATGARVAAAFAFQPGTLQPTGALLGWGKQNVTIESSPLSAARAAQDAFLNGRFLLALLVASFIYFWQFWAQQPTFGAHSFDYVKAFALGAVVQAAVTNLPEALAKLPFG